MLPIEPAQPTKRLRVRQRLGKYRIEKLLAQGGFADVFRAYDTIEGIKVALKVPRPELVGPAQIEDFRKEVRLTARLEHPNILPIKNADFVDGHFVVISHLGDETLAERLKRRISFPRAIDFADQILDALAYAHAHSVMHCDVKPDNLILFEDRLRLTDFGISRVAMRTFHGSGSGTLGFMAPEQAMGRPSFRSDVFAAGLILYRLFAGVVPEWPFEWPPPRFDRVRRLLHPELVSFLRRSLSVDPRRRYADGTYMLESLRSLRAKAERYKKTKSSRRAPARKKDWRAVQLSHFRTKYQKVLQAGLSCRRCERPVSESMLACPWCGAGRRTLREESSFPAACKRCKRGVKLDWVFCPWCYGASIGPSTNKSYTDKRYVSKCAVKTCRGELMPFMRYCPWCRGKVRKPWSVPGSTDVCPSCAWGVLHDYWSVCPWCTSSLKRVSGKGMRRRTAR